MRLEAERYRIDDAIGNKGDIDLASIGLVYRFGPPTLIAIAPAPLPQGVLAARRQLNEFGDPKRGLAHFRGLLAKAARRLREHLDVALHRSGGRFEAPEPKVGDARLFLEAFKARAVGLWGGRRAPAVAAQAAKPPQGRTRTSATSASISTNDPCGIFVMSTRSTIGILDMIAPVATIVSASMFTIPAGARPLHLSS